MSKVKMFINNACLQPQAIIAVNLTNMYPAEYTQLVLQSTVT